VIALRVGVAMGHCGGFLRMIMPRATPIWFEDHSTIAIPAFGM